MDGSIVLSDTNGISGGNRSRTVALPRFVVTGEGGRTVQRLSDVPFELMRSVLPLDDSQVYGLVASGSVTGDGTGGVTVAIETTTRFLISHDDAGAGTGPVEGEMAFRAEDGRSGTLTPRDDGVNPIFVDAVTVGADGQARATERVAFPELTVLASDDRSR